MSKRNYWKWLEKHPNITDAYGVPLNDDDYFFKHFCAMEAYVRKNGEGACRCRKKPKVARLKKKTRGSYLRDKANGQ